MRAVKVITVGVEYLQIGPRIRGRGAGRASSRGWASAWRARSSGARPSWASGCKAGQVLAQLDPQDYQLAAERRAAQLAAASTNRDLAAADFKRYRDAARPELHQRRRTGAPRDHLEGGAGATGAGAGAAGVAGQPGRLHRRWWPTCRAWSPAIEAEPGQVVAAGTPVVRIAQDGPRDVVFAVPEDKVGADQAGLARWRCACWAGGTAIAGQGARSRGQRRPGHPHLSGQGGARRRRNAGAGRHGLRAAAGPEPCRHAGDQAADQRAAPGRAGHARSGCSTRPRMTVQSQPVQVATADGNEAVIAGGPAAGHAGGGGRRARAVAGAEGHDLPGQDVSARRQPRSRAAPPMARRPHPAPRKLSAAMSADANRKRASTSRAGRSSTRRSRAT